MTVAQLGTQDPTTVRLRVRRYLYHHEDLARASASACARRMGMNPVTMARRLRGAGTSWAGEKRREQCRRLSLLVKKSGRVNIRKAARFCGYETSEAFLVFFKQHQGRTYTQWRLARQREAIEW
ncbi:MAG: hypothetical protein CME59_02315 [Halioglobus sp.]|nr:hypothetical protein [Halioglobus sp.]|tara:strand:- start:12157 stop:12528 length:372 start_codon:yes stop_codon:yes gene_type:complete